MFNIEIFVLRLYILFNRSRIQRLHLKFKLKIIMRVNKLLAQKKKQFFARNYILLIWVWCFQETNVLRGKLKFLIQFSGHTCTYVRVGTLRKVNRHFYLFLRSNNLKISTYNISEHITIFIETQVLVNLGV